MRSGIIEYTMHKKHILLWSLVAIGALMIASPWLLGFGAIGGAVLVDLVGGAAVAILSLWLIYWERLDEELPK